MTLGPLRFTNALGGTADFIYPGPSIDMQSPAAAGTVDGAVYRYYAQSFDMSQWETGTGAYTASSGTFARTTVSANSLGTTAKINFSNPPQIFIIDSFGGGRLTLSTDTTYYVRTDGSDSNTGLADTAGGAFATIAKALSVASALDTANFQLTIQVDAGTWTIQVLLPRMVGGKIPILTGVGSTTISTGDVLNDGATPWQVNNMKFVVASDYSLHARNGGVIQFSGIEFGASGGESHIFSEDTSAVRATGDYSISGGTTSCHVIAAHGYVAIGQVTITLTGTPAFATAFARATAAGYLWAYHTTFSGSATGPRYLADINGVIFTSGAGATYFPGNSAGSITTGGQYT